MSRQFIGFPVALSALRINSTHAKNEKFAMGISTWSKSYSTLLFFRWLVRCRILGAVFFCCCSAFASVFWTCWWIGILSSFVIRIWMESEFESCEKIPSRILYILGECETIIQYLSTCVVRHEVSLETESSNF